jgi:hypothetical protein
LAVGAKRIVRASTAGAAKRIAFVGCLSPSEHVRSRETIVTSQFMVDEAPACPERGPGATEDAVDVESGCVRRRRVEQLS